jgi:hypothetical protein
MKHGHAHNDGPGDKRLDGGGLRNLKGVVVVKVKKTEQIGKLTDGFGCEKDKKKMVN